MAPRLEGPPGPAGGPPVMGLKRPSRRIASMPSSTSSVVRVKRTSRPDRTVWSWSTPRRCGAGSTCTGEICEIAGIGPVPVEAAIELLGQGSLQFLLKEGTDIRCVTRSNRDLAQKTAMALTARDRVCVVPGCGKRLGLEGDHIVEFEHDGPTTYDNLARICPAHHAMKTYGKWTLSGGVGKWKWTPPARPLSAGAISRTRRVATAKAKGNAVRNNRRQT